MPERGWLLEDSSGGKLSHEMAGGGNHRFPYAQQVSDLLSEKRLDNLEFYSCKYSVDLVSIIW